MVTTYTMLSEAFSAAAPQRMFAACSPASEMRLGKSFVGTTKLRRDFLIHAEKDGQAIFDALGAQEKGLLWIENSNQRVDAYNHFGQHPEHLIGWFDRHMGGRATDRPSSRAQEVATAL